MYLPGQVVYDKDRKVPFQMSGNVWDTTQYPKRHTHFIKHGPGWFVDAVIAMPQSIAEAQDLLDKGIIVPAPANTETHCWHCGNWYNNCRHFKTCPESDKPLPLEAAQLWEKKYAQEKR